MAVACWVGLDVGAKEIFACAIDEHGKRLAEKKLAYSPTEVREFCNAVAVPVERIALEAGSSSHSLTRALRSLGLSVHVYETRQASRFLKIKQNKTDTNDARGLAELVRLGHGVVSEVYVKSAEFQHLRSKLALRQILVRHRVASESAILSTFRVNGGSITRSYSASQLRRNVILELARISEAEGVDLSSDIIPILRICEMTRSHLERLDRALKKLTASIPVCKNFLEIPGVGFITALSVYSAVEDPFRFTKSTDVGAYFGLVPKVLQSGTSSRYLAISKMGNRMTRSHLASASNTLLKLKKADCDLQDWGLGLAARSDRRRARVAVARKLAVLMISMWKSGMSFVPRANAGLEKESPSNRASKRWSEIDDEFLRERYALYSSTVLARQLGRSQRAIFTRASKHGLTKTVPGAAT